MTAVANPIARRRRARRSGGELLASYLGDERARRISHRYLPSREAIVEILRGRARSHVPGLLRPPRPQPRRTWPPTSRSRSPRWRRRSSAKWSTACATGASARRRGRISANARRGRANSTQIFLSRLPEIRRLLLARRAGGLRRRSRGDQSRRSGARLSRRCWRSASIASRTRCTIWACR